MCDIQDEEVLVRAWAEGDTAASLRMVELHGKSMLRVALALCHRPEDAEEVVQDAFLLALRARESFDARRGSLRSWLLGVTTNRARQLKRGVVRYRNLLARLQRDPYQHEAARVGSGDLAFARRKLASLPAREREAFVLVDIEELTSRDAAAVMGVADSTVRVLAARARSRLDERITDLRAASMRAEGGR